MYEITKTYIDEDESGHMKIVIEDKSIVGNENLSQEILNSCLTAVRGILQLAANNKVIKYSEAPPPTPLKIATAKPSFLPKGGPK